MYLIRPTKPADVQIGMLCAAFSELLCTLHIQNWCMMHHRNDCVRCNNLQNITQKTKDRATRTPLKTGVTSDVAPVMLILLQPDDKSWMRKEPDCYHDNRRLRVLFSDLKI